MTKTPKDLYSCYFLTTIWRQMAKDNKKDLDGILTEEAKTQNKDSAKDISNKVDNELSKNYIKGEIVGEMGAAAGSYLGAKIGETYIKGQSRLLNVLSGSIPGDYLLGSLFSGAYWGWKNKDSYKGWNGKKQFIKDQLNFHVREAPATVASYLAYAPLTAAGLALGLAAGPAAAIASVLSSALYIGGSYMLNKKYLTKLGRKQAKESLSPASSQAPQYKLPEPAYRPA